MSSLKTLVKIGGLLLCTGSVLTVQATYVPTNKDTLMPPETLVYTFEDPSQFKLLYESSRYAYYFKDENDVLAIHDKAMNYVWKTGIDVEFDKDIEDRCDALLDQGVTDIPTLLNTCVPLEASMNTIYEGIANSLLTIEVYDKSLNFISVSSSDYSGATSLLYQVDGKTNEYVLSVQFSKYDIAINCRLTFHEDGMTYTILDEDIRGQDTNVLAAILLNPFLGASGGEKNYFDPVKLDYDKRTVYPNDMLPGYIFVPDGSGSLIRYQNNQTKLSTYRGDVYGVDVASNLYYYDNEPAFVPLKDPLMPVYGVAIGNRQMAFVGYAEQGAEHMEILVSPDENKTPYNYVYPRFAYNGKYTQVYNQSGAGYDTLFDERFHFDVKMTYQFLSGDGSTGQYPADYVGMARTYRDYLIDQNILHPVTNYSDDIPLRVDFVMADVAKTTLGFQDMIVTEANQVNSILRDMKNLGVDNISAGLMGYQKGGISLGVPWAPRYSSSIGSYRDFQRLFEEANELGIDLSFMTPFATIYAEQMGLNNVATKHVNNLFTRSYLAEETLPMTVHYYAKPTKVAEWMLQHYQATKGLQIPSMTLQDVGLLLYSNYGSQPKTLEETRDLYISTLDTLRSNVQLNVEKPNQYLWSHVDRFLQAPVFPSQYLIETDTVPFLQLVLQGTMELFAPYVNFSFYTTNDLLRMIDYNVYPSFVFSHDPSYELISTQSSQFFSTEYTLYRELLQTTYNTVNGALGHVRNATWIDRQVLQPGVILNRYNNGTHIVINYTDGPVMVLGQLVASQSYAILMGGNA